MRRRIYGLSSLLIIFCTLPDAAPGLAGLRQVAHKPCYVRAKLMDCRPLLFTDLGLTVDLDELVGQFCIDGDVASVQIGMIRGVIREGEFFVMKRALIALARNHGARTLVVEATIVNATLLAILQRRYNVISNGHERIVLEIQ